MKNLKDIYIKYKNSGLFESVTQGISDVSSQSLIDNSDKSILDYRDVLIKLLEYLQKKRHRNTPSIFINKENRPKMEIEWNGANRPLPISEIGLNTYGKGLNFHTGYCLYPEHDVAHYNPKEVFDAVNWDDVEWKYHFNKEKFLEYYFSLKESVDNGISSVSDEDLLKQADKLPWQIEVEELLKRYNNIDDIEWYSSNSFQTKHGEDGYIFKNKDDAKNSLLFGDDHQNALDYVDGCVPDDDWIEILHDLWRIPYKEAEEIIKKGDWETVVQIIVESGRLDFFLGGGRYKGYELDCGYVLYF